MFKTIIILVFSSTVLAYINFEVAPEASYKINVTKLFNIKQKWNIQSNGIYFPSKKIIIEIIKQLSLILNFIKTFKNFRYFLVW